MRAIFLADAHLCKPTDPNYRALLKFLRSQTGRTDVVAFLGDIFEFWIGKDTPPREHHALIELLEDMVSKGTRLVYVEGNHDFHLGPVFTQRLHCQVMPDGGSIELEGKKIYLAHGDLANPEDLGYRRLRQFLRSKLVRGLIRTLPNRFIMSIATRASFESRKSSSEKRDRWPAIDILKPYAEAFIETGHDIVITAHYHHPCHKKVGDGELIALGDWITQYSYAVYENGRFQLTNYQEDLADSAAPS